MAFKHAVILLVITVFGTSVLTILVMQRQQKTATPIVEQNSNNSDTAEKTIVDIDTTDSETEVAVSTNGNATTFYRNIPGNSSIIGTVPGSINPEDNNEELLTIDGAGTVVAHLRGQILQTWFYDVVYTLGVDHTLSHVDQSLYPINTDVTLKQPLTIHESPTNFSTTHQLAIGDHAAIEGCDNVAWCKIKNTTGTEGWFELDNFSHITGTEWYASDVFDGLVIAD